MRRAQLGDELAYRQLLTEIGSASERFLRRKIGTHHFVEDCVQEALVSIHEARHTWDPARPFRPWLYAIVRNKAIDELRRVRRESGVFENPGAELPDMAAPAETAGEDGASVLGSALAALPAPLRDALVLTRLHGLSTAEAAARLRISGIALRVRVHRAVSRLRSLLEEDSGA
jgi:RNA polymerase sigma-70 factor (ECF subfamily)